jgi:hypothetical protein
MYIVLRRVTKMAEGERLKKWERLQKLEEDLQIPDNTLLLEEEWDLVKEHEASRPMFTQELLNQMNREILKRRAFDAYKLN